MHIARQGGGVITCVYTYINKESGIMAYSSVKKISYTRRQESKLQAVIWGEKWRGDEANVGIFGTHYRHPNMDQKTRFSVPLSLTLEVKSSAEILMPLARAFPHNYTHSGVSFVPYTKELPREAL